MVQEFNYKDIVKSNIKFQNKNNKEFFRIYKRFIEEFVW